MREFYKNLKHIILAISILKVAEGSIFDKTKRCSLIDIPLCKDIPYNKTIIPNPFFETDELSLQAHTEHFKPLIKTKCNPHVQFFVCSAFAPMCPDQMPQAVTSCRSVCEEVKKDCLKILHDFDIQWPSMLNCSRFPEAPNLCMKPESPLQISKNYIPKDDNFSPSSIEKLPACPHDLINLDPIDPNSRCAFHCLKSTMFLKEEKEQAKIWIILWTFLNMIVTLFTVLTFLIDRQRFRFPERSIFYISLSYFFFSLPYLTRLVLSFEQTACAQLSTGQKFLIQSEGGHDNRICIISFLFQYYFSIAGVLWWLMLTFTWYLSAAKKWVQEEIEKRSGYIHLVAWGIPAILSISVLILHKIDASELTGICSVGNSDPWTLLEFLILPRASLILLGLCFIVAGFSSMCRERKCFKRRGTDTTKLKQLMYKMGMFSMLYVIPANVIVFCDCYQFFVLLQWFPTTFNCKQNGGTYSGMCTRLQQPQANIYILNITMSLTVGLATGLWIFSFKTLQAWNRFFCCSECQVPSTTKKTYPGSNYDGSQQQFLLTRPLIPAVPTPNSYPPHPPQQVDTAVVLEHPSHQPQLFHGSKPRSNGGHYMTQSFVNGGGMPNVDLRNSIGVESGGQFYDMSWKTSNIL